MLGALDDPVVGPRDDPEARRDPTHRLVVTRSNREPFAVVNRVDATAGFERDRFVEEHRLTSTTAVKPVIGDVGNEVAAERDIEKL